MKNIHNEKFIFLSELYFKGKPHLKKKMSIAIIIAVQQ